jgi:hypothetical protein
MMQTTVLPLLSSFNSCVFKKIDIPFFNGNHYLQTSDPAKEFVDDDDREQTFGSGKTVGRHDGRRQTATVAAAAASTAAAKHQNSFAKFQSQQR